MHVSRLNRFLLSHGASAFATGVHLVVVAWLAVAEFGLSASQWGWVQAAGLLPNLLLMPVAGAMADRLDPAKMLCAAQSLLSCAYMCLLLLLLLQYQSFWALWLYAATVGSAMAFVQPVREKLLTELRHDSVQRRIAKLSMTQFALQSLGVATAALSTTLGFAVVVLLQVLMSGFAALNFYRLRGVAVYPAAASHNTPDQLRRVFAFVRQHRGLKQLMALIAFNGYMHMGVFVVMIPFVATDNYQFNASEYAVVQLLFVLGMMLAHLALLYGKTLSHPGQGALFSLLYTALIGFALAKAPTSWGFYTLMFLWGGVAGYSAGRCRLVLQLLIAADMKGRLMAVYQLILFGAAAIGALVTGYVLNYLTIDRIFVFMSTSSIALFVCFMFSRTLWAIEQKEDEAPTGSG